MADSFKSDSFTHDSGKDSFAPDSVHGGAGDTRSVGEKLLDPQIWKKIAVGDPNSNVVQGTPPMAMPVGQAPDALMKIASFLGKSGALPSLARAGTNAAIGGIQGGLPGAAMGGALSVGGDALSGASGKVADYLAQKAVGMRKYIPGVGNDLNDLNVWGTRKGMAGDVPDKLAQQEGKLQDLAASLKGNVNSKDLSDAVSQHAKRFQLASGEVPLNVKPEMDKVRATAEGLSGLNGGQLGAEDLIRLKRQGDYLGYAASGNPATSLEADLGRAQADQARKSLSDLSQGQDETVPEILRKEKALILANKALDKPDVIHQGVGSSLFFGKVPGQALLGSTAAQAAQKLGAPAGNAISNPLILQSAIKGLFSNQE